MASSAATRILKYSLVKHIKSDRLNIHN